MSPLNVEACEYSEIRVERIQFVPPFRSLPRHGHREFQIGHCDGSTGKYSCRNRRFPSGPDKLQVFRPFEAHSYEDVELCRAAPTHRVLYIQPELMQRAATGIASGTVARLPYFPNPVVSDAVLVSMFLEVHSTLLKPTSTLERESVILEFLTTLIVKCAQDPPHPDPLTAERPAVRRVRHYIQTHFARNLLLEELAKIANLSPWRLNRVFSREVGLPPHLYQTQLRVARAKSLLAAGTAVARVAQVTGFADQAHLTRHFKKFVGTTPSRYKRGGKVIRD